MLFLRLSANGKMQGVDILIIGMAAACYTTLLQYGSLTLFIYVATRVTLTLHPGYLLANTLIIDNRYIKF